MVAEVFESSSEPIERIDPNDPSWSVWIAFGVWAASVAAIIFVPGLFLLSYLASVGVSLSDSEQLAKFSVTDPMAIIVQIAAVIPAHLFTLALAWVVVTGFNRKPFFESLGWDSAGLKWWHYLAMMGAFVAISLAVVNVVPVKPDDMERIIRSSRTALYLVVVMAVVTAPLVEEVVYRGVLYSAFQKRIGVTAAVALVTFLFTIVHVPQYAENPAKIALLAMLSLALTWLRAFTGSLLPSIVLHTLINASQSALLLVEPYLAERSTIETISFYYR